MSPVTDGGDDHGFHRPVLVDAVVAAARPVPPGWALDLTLGGGGHAEALLDARPDLRLLGIDQDAEARAQAARRLERFSDRVVIAAARFDRVADVAAAHGVAAASFALADLGVSSHQLDEPGRGFSHRFDAPLDMRMDPTAARTADDVVNRTSEAELAALLAAGGEERFARRVARAIVAARPVTSTAGLAELVRGAIPAPARRRGGDPANRAFQAIRIAVNDELAILEPTLEATLALLQPGGRFVVLAYHSGEDRIVKRTFARMAAPPPAPRGLPVAAPAPFRLVRGLPRKASDEEVAANRRAAPARLRAIERVPDSEEAA